MANRQPVPSSNLTSSSASATNLEVDLGSVVIRDLGSGPETDDTRVRIKGGGYNELAGFMAIHPGAAIFRRFQKWHIMKLLFLQAELTGLEREMTQCVKEDRDSADTHRQLYNRDYWEFGHRTTDPNTQDDNEDQWNTWTRMSPLLKEYAETLRHVRSIGDAHEVDKDNRETLQNWIDENIVLIGAEWNQWRTVPKDDLMALNERIYDDQLTKHVEKRLVPWYNQMFGRWYKKPMPDDSPLAGAFTYDAHDIRRIVSVIVTGLAAALPIGAIAVLSLPFDNPARLCLMAFFTFSFSLCFGFLFGAKKTEIFAASAAFAAVQVVFVSGNPSCITT